MSPFPPFALPRIGIAPLWALLLAALAFLAIPAGAGEDHEGGEEHGSAEESPLVLDAEARREHGLALAAASRRPLQAFRTAPAEVRVNQYTAAQATPRIQAQVTARHVRLGQRVRAGQPLVSLSSVAMAEAQAALLEADREWQRVKRLGRQVVSERRWVAAQVARQLAYARVLAYGMSPGEVEALLEGGDARRADGSFSLLAPVAGTVVHDAFVLGEVVDPGRVLVEIADEGTVWVEAQVSPAEAARIRPGQEVTVVAADGSRHPGRILQMAHRVSEQSRTLGVRIEVPNPEDRLHPGQLVEALLPLEAGPPVLAVPSGAVLLLQGGPAVFVLEEREPDGHWRFAPRPVRTGRQAAGWTEIREGLSEGEEVVVQGAYALKALMLKSQLGEGHGH